VQALVADVLHRLSAVERELTPGPTT
jgi:hypothetical protein